MKKLVTLFFVLFGSLSLFAQHPVRWEAGLYGGLNMEEVSPDFGAYLSVERFHIRGELDVGWGNIQDYGHNFVYISPMVGFYVGDEVECFFLAGATNWGGIDNQSDRFSATHIVPRIKLGGEVPLFPCLCLSVYWCYNIPIAGKGVSLYNYNAIMVSLGFKF